MAPYESSQDLQEGRKHSSSSSSICPNELFSDLSSGSEYEYDEYDDNNNQQMHDHTMMVDTTPKASQPSLVDMANAEIEQLRQEQEHHHHHNNNNKNKHFVAPKLFQFPTACGALVQSLPGNQRCIDCGAYHPTWAAVSYGAMLCLQCSGYHRSLGVQVSCVRSVPMDEWSLPQIVAMLEGGNTQLHNFFDRHCLGRDHVSKQPSQQQQPSSSSQEQWQVQRRRTSFHYKLHNKDKINQLRYKTKAALFYRQQLSLHVDRVLQQQGGKPYQARQTVPQ